jgi:hypothetical protein
MAVSSPQNLLQGKDENAGEAEGQNAELYVFFKISYIRGLVTLNNFSR